MPYKDPKQHAAAVKRWKQHNRDAANEHAKVARKRLREAVYGKSPGRCWYCGVKITLSTMHVDHHTPVARGGRTLLKNLFPACAACNRRKRDMPPEAFEQAFYDDYQKLRESEQRCHNS